MTELKVGAQLYIFREKHNLATEIRPILALLSESGYVSIEGFYREEQDFRASLDCHGLTYAAAHLVTAELNEPNRVADYVRLMGGQDVCVSGPLQWNERTADDWRKTADILNHSAEVLQAQGVRLNYHNHDFEFAQVEGELTAMDLLLETLDFNRVKLCLDAGWLWRMEQDPAAFLKTHSEKIGVLHLRDFKGTQSVSLGEGDIDQRPILAVIPDLPHLRHIIVEQDPDAENPGLAMQLSRRYLQTLSQ